MISAVGLLWRLRKAGPHATVSEEGAAEKRALNVVAVSFFLLAIHIMWEAVKSLINREEPCWDYLGRAVAGWWFERAITADNSLFIDAACLLFRVASQAA